MRIPHHLSRSSTGRWSFVQRVPYDLQAVLDCRLIKRTLKTKDLAQAHVREEENTAAPRISRYERGDRMPDNESMAKLVEALDLPVAYFHAVSEPMAEAILVISQLPEDAQEELVRQMRDFARNSLRELGASVEVAS